MTFYISLPGLSSVVEVMGLHDYNYTNLVFNVYVIRHIPRKLPRIINNARMFENVSQLDNHLQFHI
jgi:hypothetical protein